MFYPLRIADVRRETADCVSLAFDVPSSLRGTFAYRPGQYVTLRATIGGEEIRRSYSICSGLDDRELRVAVKHAPGGRFSGHANTCLTPGDIVDVMPPEGRFGAAIGPHTYLAVAAGSGITPILAILTTVLVREPDANCILLYGSRSTPEIIFRSALEDLKDRHLSRIAITHVLSREEQDRPILSGRLDGEKIRRLLPTLVEPAAVDHALLCGPGDMIEAATETLASLGVPPPRIHSEHFTPPTGSLPARSREPCAEAPFATGTIIHDGKTNDIPIASGEPILEAAIRAGLDLPWSCRGGMCSTCRARLTKGAATMDTNYALEPWEIERGYVLTCQARPTTPHVTVDYDAV